MEYQLLKVLCGSRAYGLEDSDSDWDYHIVFATPTRELLSVTPNTKATLWSEGETDTTGWEVGHFLKLALNCNPTVLETFVAPTHESSYWGEELRRLFPFVLSKRRVYEAFMGYARNQRKKMFELEGSTQAYDRELKFSVAYTRGLIQGTELLKKGYYDVKLGTVDRDFLSLIKQGQVSKGEIIDQAVRLEKDLVAAYLTSTLKEEPDITQVNKVLLALRRDLW